MRDFKFFQNGTVDDSQMLNESTHITASFNDDTPEGVMNRRRLYHTDINLYNRLRQSNNEMEQFYLDRQIREEMNQTTIPSQSHDIGMSNYVPPIGESYYQRFFPQVTVTTVNPNWRTKIKMFFQKINMNIQYNSELIGIVVIAGSITIGVILIISKLLNAW